MFDYNDADQQRSGELIPEKTVCKLMMTIRPGNAGPEGWLTDSASSDAQYLNAEFTVLEGPFVNRKLWQNMVVSGGKQNEKGQSIAGEITRSTLRAMLESARNIQPTDMSEAACVKRRVQSFSEFDQMIFVAKIGIEKGKDGYQDKNKIAVVITPDKKEYQAVMSEWAVSEVAPSPFGGGSAQGGISPAPSWAFGSAPTVATSTPKSTVPAWAV
jgi:hypothetical protein